MPTATVLHSWPHTYIAPLKFVLKMSTKDNVSMVMSLDAATSAPNTITAVAPFTRMLGVRCSR